MKIAITGSTGLVGSALVASLNSNGHEVLRIVRGDRAGKKLPERSVAWNPERNELDGQALAGVDAVVHLAGEGIANRRWTAAQKEKIRSSRVQGTQLLAATLARMPQRPQTLISASAIGFYGDRGEEHLTEDSPAGTGFLPDVCREWEAATAAAREAGIRVVNLRIGIVLSPQGGALAKMLTPFKLGVGGVLGSGRQYMSWIALDDLVGVIQHALTNSGLSGPVNAVTSQPVTNREFTKTLGRVLRRPTIFPMPAFAACLAFGEMADALLLSSAHVDPNRLETSGYSFRYPDLEAALRFLLGR